MAFWMKPLTIMGLFCSQLSDLLLNCISFIVEPFTCKILFFFVMYFLICFWGNASSTINKGKQMKLWTDWNLIPLLFSPHFTAQCLTCRQCPIGIFGTCFLSKDVTCTNTNQSCFTGDARKETFFPLLWRYSDRESSELRKHIRKNRNTFRLCSNDKGWLNKIKYFRWNYYIKNLGLPVKY